MAKIRNENTLPEKLVRKILFKLGYRFTLHKNGLPCKPDVILAKYKTVIFVNGCFWHRHEGCKLAYTPKSNSEFWQKKFNQNVERDKRNTANLKKLGWNVVIIWECETQNLQNLESLLHYFISSYRMSQIRETDDKIS